MVLQILSEYLELITPGKPSASPVSQLKSVSQFAAESKDVHKSY